MRGSAGRSSAKWTNGRYSRTSPRGRGWGGGGPRGVGGGGRRPPPGGSTGEAESRGVGTRTALPVGRGSSPVGSIGEAESRGVGSVAVRWRRAGGLEPAVAGLERDE